MVFSSREYQFDFTRVQSIVLHTCMKHLKIKLILTILIKKTHHLYSDIACQLFFYNDNVGCSIEKEKLKHVKKMKKKLLPLFYFHMYGMFQLYVDNNHWPIHNHIPICKRKICISSKKKLVDHIKSMI